MYTEGGLEDLQHGYVFGDWSESFEEHLGNRFVSHPPDGWEDGERPTDADDDLDSGGTKRRYLDGRPTFLSE